MKREKSYLYMELRVDPYIMTKPLFSTIECLKHGTY